MIISAFETILLPIIEIMRFVFEGFVWVTDSVGWSIVLLSLAIALLTAPLRKYAQNVEGRIRCRKILVDREIKVAAAGLKGEEKFRVVERIYERHGFHPIQSIATSASFFVMLPFLLSALYLFSSLPLLIGESFYLVADLAKADRLAWGVNVLPFLMTGITIADACIRFKRDRSALLQFLAIAFVMFLLVYSFNAGIVLYWTTSNLVSFGSYLFQRSVTVAAHSKESMDA